MVGLAPKWVRLAPNGTIPGLFRSDFSALARNATLSKDGRFGSKVVQIGPKWDNSGAFSDQISVHWREMH